MKQPLFIRLDPEQIEHVKSQPNQSVYIQELIKKDQHRETRFDYVWPVIEKYVINEHLRTGEIRLITDLTMKLARQISGSDVLTEIMEGGQK
jgi:hypothetical protein